MTELEVDVVERIAAAVLDVPGVVELYGGLFGEIATYLPGRRVAGVSMDEYGTEIHIVVDISYDLLEVAETVRISVTELTGEPVSVTVEDVVSESGRPDQMKEVTTVE